jgi:hypothetical protein
MSTSDLKLLLDDVPDTLEMVLRREPRRPLELEAWREAKEEARFAFAGWCARPGPASYAAYRAAQDREDAAQDALFHTQTSRSSVS